MADEPAAIAAKGHRLDLHDLLAWDCNTLISEAGVATAPGIDFDPVDGSHFIRFSFAVSTPEVEEALTRLEPWFAGFRFHGMVLA